MERSGGNRLRLPATEPSAKSAIVQAENDVEERLDRSYPLLALLPVSGLDYVAQEA
jgi:hypothetical protein